MTLATNGNPVKNVSINWGDGTSQDAGAFTGALVQQHIFTAVGTYAVTGTVTDTNGASSSVSSSVTVLDVAKAGIVISANPASPQPANTSVSFTFTITAPTGTAIKSVSVNWDDGTPIQQLGGAGSFTLAHKFADAGTTYKITVTVVDTSGQISQGFATFTTS